MLNNRFTQVLFLGAALCASLGIAPAQAQTVIPPYTPTDGAQQVLDNCPATLTFGQKCDPNAQVVDEASSADTAGLHGSFNFTPLEAPGGVKLDGTGFTDPSGDPLANIDFLPPEGQNIGQIITINAGVGSDFQAYQGWTGTVKDLRLTGTNGVPFPGPGNPRIRDFIRVADPGSGSGIVDEVQTGGFALDAVFAGFPQYEPAGPFNTRVTISTQLQAYKLDTNGNRIEEQIPIPVPFPAQVFANIATGTFAATFPGTPDTVKALFDSPSDPPVTASYDVSIDVAPDNRIITESEIPEPTTIISSLLLLGGGAFKLNRRKRA
jgi:hypothetical protein